MRDEDRPTRPMTSSTAAQALVRALLAHGVRRVFCVPGESYLAVLDALRDSEIDIIVCRHEAGAANMAEAHGKLTGEPGVCFVTRGPGATHASVGVHTARQDSTPFILFIGQVALADRGREAFQEIDYRAFFGPITKWADEADSADRMPEFVARAFATALQGRPGPVALALPEDVLTASCSGVLRPVAGGVRQGVSPDALASVEAAIEAAQTPVLLLGGGDWGAARGGAVAAAAERLGLPVVCSFRRKDLIDNDHPHYAGDLGLGPNPKLLARLREADLILAIGARLGENPTQGYTLFDPAQTASTLIHVHPDPEELNKLWPARLAICAQSSEAIQALAAGPVRPDLTQRFAGLRASMRAEYEAWSQPLETVGAVNLSQVFAHLAQTLPANAIVCNGAGNYAAWLHRFFRHRAGGRQLAPTSGAMGYGVPAAIAAKLAAPEREVVAVAGDGCFLMTGQELATAVQHRAAVRIIVADNGSYGTIRMHQERAYPGRVVGTDLRNPDFAAYARAFGVWAATVERTQDFPEALRDALRADGPALIHLKVNVEDIAPGRRLSANS